MVTQSLPQNNDFNNGNSWGCSKNRKGFNVYEDALKARNFHLAGCWHPAFCHLIIGRLQCVLRTVPLGHLLSVLFKGVVFFRCR